MEPGKASAITGGLGTLVSAFGSIFSGNAQSKAAKAAAKNTKNAAKFEAAQYNQAAGQERASSQRAAIEARRQGRLKQSRAVAVAAASGAGASDPTVMNIIADLAGEGEYNALTALYNGEESARGLEMKAKAAMFQGKSDASAYKSMSKAYKTNGYLEGVGTMLSGSASFFEKYGGEEDVPVTTAPSRTPQRTSYWKIN